MCNWNFRVAEDFESVESFVDFALALTSALSLEVSDVPVEEVVVVDAAVVVVLASVVLVVVEVGAVVVVEAAVVVVESSPDVLSPSLAASSTFAFLL